MKQETKKCSKCREEFALEEDDFSFYEKMKVPAPNICPDCRFKMRAMWRNETTLYSGQKCKMCNKSVVTMYNPKLAYIVYCNDCYISDKWDSKSFIEDYNFDVPFFKQFKKLFDKTPQNATFLSTSDGPNINSDYSNMAGGMKNCYMNFNGGAGEEIIYSRGVRYAKEVGDSYFGEYLERCYECISVLRSNGLTFSRNTYDSMDSSFLLNCAGLNNCFGCVNLRNKSYCFLNKSLEKEEYFKKINEIVGSYSGIEKFKKEFKEYID